MGLEADAVDLDAAGLERLDDVLGCGGLGPGVLDVVIVVVQLDIRIVQNCSLERDGDILSSNLALVSISHGVRLGGTYGGVEDVNPVGAIVIEGFIDHVPGVALALIVGDLALDMGLQRSNKGGVRPGARRDLYALAAADCVGTGWHVPQLGSSLYHTRLWHLISWLLAWAKLVMTSPWVKLNPPFEGSVYTHFWVFPGVICPKLAEFFRMAV
jgi:hypothetical protein